MRDKKTKARIRVGITGATGKMGRILQELIQNDPVWKTRYMLVFAVSGPQDPTFHTLERERPDVLIDFSNPQSTLGVAKLAAELKIPMLVGTTGFSKLESEKLGRTLKRVPWILAPNTSLGVAACAEALRSALKILPKEVVISIIEIHHSEKKDAPSGTAKLLAHVVESATGRTDLQTTSIRGGTEAGEHRIILIGQGERLEIVHRAANRTVFAHGALRLALRLLELKARTTPYTVRELVNSGGAAANI